MADAVSMVFFSSDRFDLRVAASVLADRGLTVRWRSDELAVRCGAGPELRIGIPHRVGSECSFPLAAETVRVQFAETGRVPSAKVSSRMSSWPRLSFAAR